MKQVSALLRRLENRLSRVPATPEKSLVPEALKKNQRQLDPNRLQAIERSIRTNYHTGWRSKSYYSEQGYNEDLAAHLCQRLELDRRTIVPWLDNAGGGLRGKRILEIGCGTGSSTVALAEQGALITGIDVDEGALAVAVDRCKNYELAVEFSRLNATDLTATFPAGAFDWIIFFACLEHMTLAERLVSLEAAWTLLPEGGLLSVVETPNRLWFFDAHTARLPFFHWLPDELAFYYSRFSPRENFKELYRDYDEPSREHFSRRGRGVSFHEFEIAIKAARDLCVISSVSTFQDGYEADRAEVDRQYKALLMAIHPGLHEGFFDEYLYLTIRKQVEPSVRNLKAPNAVL